jgi:hypothetical protein
MSIGEKKSINHISKLDFQILSFFSKFTLDKDREWDLFCRARTKQKILEEKIQEFYLNDF